jgi:Mn-containing catalase
MFLSINKLPNHIPPGDRPDPKAAQALQQGLSGQFGEMRTMMQYLFQNMNFRGDVKPISRFAKKHCNRGNESC